jgi:hypothetical protein
MEAGAMKPAATPMKANETLIMGRINHVSPLERDGKRVFETRVAIPSADLYSMPGAVVVQSLQKLGSPGDDVRVLCTVTGIPDKWTDKAGEIKHTARIFLRASE